MDFARYRVLLRSNQRDRNFALHCSMLVVIGLLDLICQRIYVVYVVEIIQHADPLKENILNNQNLTVSTQHL